MHRVQFQQQQTDRPRIRTRKVYPGVVSLPSLISSPCLRLICGHICFSRCWFWISDHEPFVVLMMNVLCCPLLVAEDSGQSWPRRQDMHEGYHVSCCDAPRYPSVCLPSNVSCTPSKSQQIKIALRYMSAPTAKKNICSNRIIFFRGGWW